MRLNLFLHLVAAGLVAPASANDKSTSELQDASAESELKEATSIEVVSNDNQVALYQHASPHRSRKLRWQDHIAISPSLDFEPGSATVTWPCKDKRWRRNDWICWKLNGQDKSPCRHNEKKKKTADIGAPNCSYEITGLQCDTTYTLRIKRNALDYNSGKDFTTGACPCTKSRPCLLHDDESSFNSNDQTCEIGAPSRTYKTNGKWFFDKISQQGAGDIFCPVIDGQQTTAINDYDCLVYEVLAGRAGFVFDGAFYYSDVFDPSNPGADRCPDMPYASSGPRNLQTDAGISFVACFVGEIPAYPSSGHLFVNGQKLLVKHNYICDSPVLCLTSQGKHIMDGVYEPVEDACFVGNIDGFSSIIVGDLNGGVKNNPGCTTCGDAHKFVYDACQEGVSARRRLGGSGRDLQGIDLDARALQERAELIVSLRCGGPPICPSTNSAIGTCTPCSTRGAAQRLANEIYGSLPEATASQIESGSLQIRSGGFGSSAEADESLAEYVARGDFSGAVLPLFFLLSRWYPDNSDGTCRNDGNYPQYMESLGWLSQSLDSCCTQHFGWAHDECMGKGEPLDPTRKFYAFWGTGTCLEDCEPGPFGCAIAPPPIEMYDTLESCCTESQPWVDLAYCESRSIEDLTDGWVVDYTNMKCVQDCDPDEGPPCAETIHADPYTPIFLTPEECCEGMFSWIDPETCLADSQGVATYSDKFYVDYSKGFLCSQDCDAVGGLPCGGNPEPYLQRYDTARDCCEGSLGWLDVDRCVADTNNVVLQAQGSQEWYVDWALNGGNGQCVKDCAVGDPSCGGLKEQWGSSYPTSSACCGSISWVSPDICHS